MQAAMIINRKNGGVNLGKKKFLSWAFLLLLLVSTALYGCSSDIASEGGEVDGGSEGGSTEEKTLIFGRGGDSVSLDQITVTDGESIKVAINGFDVVVYFDKL